MVATARRWALAVLATATAAAMPLLSAEAQSADEAQVKAAFVYNFLKFVEWPKGAAPVATDSFVVVIVGNGKTADAAATFLPGKHVAARPIAVRRSKWDEPIFNAQAAFISVPDTAKLRRVLDDLQGSAVLSIGEDEGFVHRGGMIGLLMDNRRVTFAVNMVPATASRISISSKLLALAKAVHIGSGSGSRP